MNKNLIKNTTGFTLIETLLYVALFAIVIGGGMVAVYQIIQATQVNASQIMLQEEANFLLRKINWALADATSASATSSVLVVFKPINGVSTKLTFALTGSDITLQRASGASIILNSSNVKVSLVSFIKTNGSNGKPDAITASFTLTSAQNSRFATQHFSITKYLWQ